MTERRGDQGFTVTPQRLGEGGSNGGGSRRRRLGLALVVAVAAAIFTIGWLGPRLSDRPNFDVSFFATPTPVATPSPSPTIAPLGPALATPLPSITRRDGPVPSGRVAVVTDGIRVLDLSTGDVTAGPSTQFGRDAIVRAPTGGGWTCICFRDGQTDAGQDLTIEVVGIGPAGEPGDATHLATFPNTVQDESGQPILTTDIDTFDVNRHGLLALATRNEKDWSLTVASIDLEGRKVGAAVGLGKVVAPPAPAPSAGESPAPPDAGPDQVYVDGPHIRISPDGRVAFVWAVLQRSTPEGNGVSAIHAWRVALDPDGSVGAVTDAPGLEAMPVYCGSAGFASADRLAWLCPDFSDAANGFAGRWLFGSVDLDGRSAGATAVTLGQDEFFGPPLFDRANGMLYAWDPTGLTVVRIDVHSQAVARSTLDPLVGSSEGLPPGGGSAPVDWHDGDSAVKLNGYAAIAADPSGDRLYAVGFDARSTSDSGAQPSRGIFVIDRSTLALVDRWAPAADYIAVAVLPDGLIAASGMPGVQTDGRLAPWEGSLTIHEAQHGQVLVRFGQLGDGNPPFVIDP
jgi:hypothetical protein